MNIGEASRQSGLPAKTLRYSEDSGLIRPAARAANGYRDNSPADVHTLRFVKPAREPGLPWNSAPNCYRCTTTRIATPEP
jgi:DNA-binding transcriptional MerR regulator